MIPTVNVNLRPCDCMWAQTDPDLVAASAHEDGCGAAPVLIPCPVPRSATFTVALGECACTHREVGGGHHWNNCPARPVRVSCSISGKTWEESEVTETEGPAGTPFMSNWTTQARDRWALVKALVLGTSPLHDVRARKAHVMWPELFPQRDAVYAALANMARHEAGLAAAVAALAHAGLNDVGLTEVRMRSHGGATEAGLAAYVARLVEQIGVMP